MDSDLRGNGDGAAKARIREHSAQHDTRSFITRDTLDDGDAG
jgi:hypothetical protein